MPVEAPSEQPPEPSNEVHLVRLLINDVDDAAYVFTDNELQQLLTLEHDSVKRAAAQAIDSQATNEALASKVLRTAAGTTTDGAKLADAMRKHAAALRAQADADDDRDDAGFFEVVDVVGGRGQRPELTGWL